MGLKQIVKKGVSIGFQPKRWLGVEQVASHGKTCLSLMKELLEPTVSPEAQAQLAQDATALQQDREALTARAKLASKLAIGYAFAGVLAFGYAFMLVIGKSLFLPAAVTAMVAMILLVYALREFMVFGQIRCGGARLPLRALIQKLLTLRKASS